MSPRPPRLIENTSLSESIRVAAWQQIAEFGAPALSLRAIARSLGITAPAIYNYFPDRDALVTALVVEAFNSFGDSQLAARDAIPAGDLAGRFLATGWAYRQWALTYPQRYQLIFGTPLPGYVPPSEQVFPAGARALSALAGVIEDLRTAGRLRTEHFPKPNLDGHIPLFNLWKSHAVDVAPVSLSIAVLIWARVHGLVSLEIGGCLPPFEPGGEALFRFELESIRREFIKEESINPAAEQLGWGQK
ncbi:MAG TPA: TetR/AcrR family transcriptional regulator [Anaerolineaceae bacterium]|nr:TetR/AcrR family transcriptional regulator [Anaerolineaceae bacterium]